MAGRLGFPSFASLPGLLAVGTLAACTASQFDNIGESQYPLDAYCTVLLGGKSLDVENDYLPHVVMCENGAAPAEALRVQAVAARTFLYYKLQTSGTIQDGQGDQVYSCNREPTAEVRAAVAATSGLVLRYAGATIASFFVAGGKGSPPSCIGGAAQTEQYVTYNRGLSGTSVKPSSLGSKSSPRNRGCMSQNGSSCLANAGEKYESILRFYYGEDIGIERSIGACIDSPGTDAGVPTADGGTSQPNPDSSMASAPSPSSPSVEDDGGGCSVARSRNGGLSTLALAFLVFAVERRRRATTSPESRRVSLERV